jgi:anaerobic ribonucleoside-triphosphate reductase
MENIEKIDSKIDEIKLKMENAGDNTAEIYQKITGYARPVSQWNLGKKEEYKDRREYDM